MHLKRLVLPALLGLAAACAAAAPAGAVVNGAEVDYRSVPWFGSLGGCGVTLVKPDRVLTAAHCVAGQTPAQFRGIAVGGIVRNARHVALHPGWRHRNGPSNYLDDVAIIELDAPIAGVPLVKLGGPAVSEAQILGYGRRFAPGTGHSEAATLDSRLRGASLKTISDERCARLFKGYRGSSLEKFDARMRCSIDADGREPLYSGCNGDSGGPLWTGPATAPVQLGVVSWGGDRCGADHLPSVFADVALYRDFILDPSPTWAPERASGRVRVSGTPRTGRRLSCSVSGYVAAAGVKLGYRWARLQTRGRFGAPRTVGRGRSYRVARGDRGHRVACFAEAANDGGFVAVGVANKLVRR